MTTKTHVKEDKKGKQEEWSWEETPELAAALAKLAELERSRPA